ncbi:MAG: PH domain-containing protein [Planctomycetaceae bacterium]
MAVQAIAGVSSTTEARIMTEFPSVAASSAGRLIGRLMCSIPVRIFGIPVSYLLFGPLVAPLGALLFFARLLGSRYILTNRSMQIWSSLGSQRTSSVDLSEVESVVIDELPGQNFYRAADIRLKSAGGQTLLRLSGVADAAAFCNVVQRAVQARRMVQSSLAVINARR